MLKITIKVEDKDAKKLVERVRHAEKYLDTTKILDDAGAAVLARNRMRFLKQEDPEGVPWLPSQAAMRRARKGRGGGTLFDTGNLFHSIQLYAPNALSRAIGTDVFYASHHQYGEGKHPMRKFLGISKGDERLITQIVKREIEVAMDKFVEE